MTGDAHPLRRAWREGRSVVLKHTLHDTTRAAEDVEDAARRGTSYELDLNLVTIEGREYFVNAHDPRAYAAQGRPFPSADAPRCLEVLPLLARLVETGIFVKLDFKSPRVIDVATAAARALRPSQRMGHAFLEELALNREELRAWEVDELLSLEDLDRVRSRLGDPDLPFQVSCHGVTEESLSEELADELARRILGRAEIINFHLPGGANPRIELAEQLWRNHGLSIEVKIRSLDEKAIWDRAGVPYLGVTDDPALATRLP